MFYEKLGFTVTPRIKKWPLVADQISLSSLRTAPCFLDLWRAIPEKDNRHRCGPPQNGTFCNTYLDNIPLQGLVLCPYPSFMRNGQRFVE